MERALADATMLMTKERVVERYGALAGRHLDGVSPRTFGPETIALLVQTRQSNIYVAEAAIFAVLREGFPACFCFCAGRGDAAFVTGVDFSARSIEIAPLITTENATVGTVIENRRIVRMAPLPCVGVECEPQPARARPGVWHAIEYHGLRARLARRVDDQRRRRRVYPAQCAVVVDVLREQGESPGLAQRPPRVPKPVVWGFRPVCRGREEHRAPSAVHPRQVR